MSWSASFLLSLLKKSRLVKIRLESLDDHMILHNFPNEGAVPIEGADLHAQSRVKCFNPFLQVIIHRLDEDVDIAPAFREPLRIAPEEDGEGDIRHPLDIPEYPPENGIQGKDQGLPVNLGHHGGISPFHRSFQEKHLVFAISTEINDIALPEIHEFSSDGDVVGLQLISECPRMKVFLFKQDDDRIG